MSVQTEIDRISTAVQNAHLKVIEKGGTSAAPYLVANLADAIDSIPEATAGEDVTAETETYTELLTDLEAAVDALPDAGSGGASVETCTVVIKNDIASKGQSIQAYMFTVVENGVVTVKAKDASIITDKELTFENVVCGSGFYIMSSGYGYAGFEASGGISYTETYGTDMYGAPTEAGAVGVLTMYDDD